VPLQLANKLLSNDDDDDDDDDGDDDDDDIAERHTQTTEALTIKISPGF